MAKMWTVSLVAFVASALRLAACLPLAAGVWLLGLGVGWELAARRVEAGS